MQKELTPPIAHEAEQVVICALLHDPDRFAVVANIVESPMLYTDTHRRIFEAIVAINEEGKTADVIAVVSLLRDSDTLKIVGGAKYIASLADFVPYTANLIQHCNAIRDTYHIRSMIETCYGLYVDGHAATDSAAYIARAADRVCSIGVGAEDRDPLAHVGTCIQEAHTIRSEPTSATIKTGFYSIDQILSMGKGKLTVIAGRPGMGKSAFASSIATSVAEEGKGVLFFNLEMGREEMVDRLVAADALVSLQALMRGTMTDVEHGSYLQSVAKIERIPMWIDDTAAMSMPMLRTRARLARQKAKAKGVDLGLIVVDYLQLMSAPKGIPREQQVAQISRFLKILSKEMGLHVIALSQLNRAVESRDPPIPTLADIRECIAGDQLVYDSISGQEVQIKDLVGINREVYVASLSERMKVSRSYLADVWSVGVKPIVKVKLRTGREIRCTSNHPLYTVNGWKPVEMLTVGSNVAVPRVLPNVEFVDLYGQRGKGIAELMGYLVSDGSYLANRCVEFTNSDAAVLDRVHLLSRTLFGIHPRLRWRKDSDAVQMTLSDNSKRGNDLIDFLKTIGMHGQRGNEKSIPECVMASESTVFCNFIGGLMSGDGSVCKRKSGSWRIKYTSTSRPLLHELQLLLTRLGIQSVITKPTRHTKSTVDIADILITEGQSIIRFAELIHVYGHKGYKLKRAQKELATNGNNAMIDRLPVDVTKEIMDAKEEKGLTWHELGYRCQGKRISRERLSTVAKVLDNERLSVLAESDILWDEVMSIEEDGEEECFDFTAYPHHSAVVNNVFVHNSGAVEQDADAILFLYRKEYYDMLKGRDVPKDDIGRCDVYIAKQRSGPTGKRTVRFISRATAFTDWRD